MHSLTEHNIMQFMFYSEYSKHKLWQMLLLVKFRASHNIMK